MPYGEHPVAVQFSTTDDSSAGGDPKTAIDDLTQPSQPFFDAAGENSAMDRPQFGQSDVLKRMHWTILQSTHNLPQIGDRSLSETGDCLAVWSAETGLDYGHWKQVRVAIAKAAHPEPVACLHFPPCSPRWQVADRGSDKYGRALCPDKRVSLTANPDPGQFWQSSSLSHWRDQFAVQATAGSPSKCPPDAILPRV